MATPADCHISSTSLEDNHILHVTVEDNASHTQTASIDLDSVIGNINGALSLGGTNFSSQARNVRLEEGGTVLDADLPDVNGDYSTSSCSLQYNINTLDGQLALLFAIGTPHSIVHTDADTVAQADQKLTEQINTVGATPDVAQMLTLHLDQGFEMQNDENKAWVQQNLGPQGAVGAAIQLGITGVCIVGGTIKAAQSHACVIM